MRLAVVFALLLACSQAAKSQVFEQYQFDIKSQSVGTALVEVALQQNLNVVFLSDITKDVKANAVAGEYTLSDALNSLLKNTGLRASITNNRTIQIEKVIIRQVALRSPKTDKEPINQEPNEPNHTELPVSGVEKILVVGKLISPYNLGATMSSTKTQRDFLDTPQIVNALPEALTKDVAARDYTGSTLLASSINYLERSAGIADELRLRGFAYPSLKINGIGAHAYIAPVDIAFIDSIEIAKGPSSVLFGRMEPGGIINMMLKQPMKSEDSLSVRFGSDQFLRGELDLSWSLDSGANFRTIGFYQQQGSKEEVNLDDAQGLMFAMDKTLSNGALLNVHYRYESQDVLQQFSRPVEGFDTRVEFFRDDDDTFDIVVPSELDLRSGLDVTRHSAYLSITDWLLGDWSSDFYIQYDQYQANSFLFYPVIENLVIDFNGESINTDDLTEALIENEEILEILIEGIETISVDPDFVVYEEEPFAYDTHFFSSEFSLYNSQYFGNVEVEQLYGVNINFSRPENLIWQTHDTRANFIPLGTDDIFFSTDDLTRNVKDANAGVFGQWVANWQDLTVFFGARLDYLDFEATTDGVTNSRSFWEPTFRLGGVYRFADQYSWFFNVSEAFSPQFDFVELSDLLDIIVYPEPARSKQIELGIKGTWLNGKLQGSCALFKIEKSDIASLIEEQRNRGAECDLVGSLGSGWHLTLGVSNIDAEIVSSDEEDFVNKRPRMTPRNTARLWLSKDIHISHEWEGQVGFGYRYIDERFIDSANFEPLDAYSVIDFNLQFDFANRLSFSIMLLNALDKEFTQGAFNALPFWTNPGIDRTLEARIEYLF